MRSDNTTPTPTPEGRSLEEEVDEVVEAVTERLGKVKKAGKGKEKSQSRKEKGTEREADQETKKRKKHRSKKDEGEKREADRRERKRRKVEVEAGFIPSGSALDEADTMISRAERKREREEKRARKEERRRRREAEVDGKSEVERQVCQGVLVKDVERTTPSSPAHPITTASLVAADSEASDPKRGRKRRKNE